MVGLGVADGEDGQGEREQGDPNQRVDPVHRALLTRSASVKPCSRASARLRRLAYALVADGLAGVVDTVDLLVAG